MNIGCRIRIGKLKDMYDSLQILFDTSHRDDVMDSKSFLMLACIELNSFTDPFAIELAKELDGFSLTRAYSWRLS